MESAAALTVRRKPYPNINILFAGQQIVPCDGIIFICKTNESKCFRVADAVMYLHVGRGFLSASITWKVNCLGPADIAIGITQFASRLFPPCKLSPKACFVIDGARLFLYAGSGLAFSFQRRYDKSNWKRERDQCQTATSGFMPSSGRFPMAELQPMAKLPHLRATPAGRAWWAMRCM